MIRLQLFIYYLFFSFFLASWGYFALDHWHIYDVFGALYRMPLYYQTYPYTYIFVVCLVYSVVAVLAAAWFHRHRKYKRTAIWLTIFVSITLAFIPGGMLWVYHDMRAGHFLTGTNLIKQLLWGAGMALEYGWIIILMSIPYNILGIIIGYYLTRRGFDKYVRQK